MELYRYLVDDFLVGFLGTVGKRDFVMKDERTTRKRRGKREFLNGSKTMELIRGLDEMFDGRVRGSEDQAWLLSGLGDSDQRGGPATGEVSTRREKYVGT
jgi:hypothetical protein